VPRTLDKTEDLFRASQDLWKDNGDIWFLATGVQFGIFFPSEGSLRKRDEASFAGNRQAVDVP
jgi:hypothetical protein